MIGRMLRRLYAVTPFAWIGAFISGVIESDKPWRSEYVGVGRSVRNTAYEFGEDVAIVVADGRKK